MASQGTDDSLEQIARTLERIAITLDSIKTSMGK